MKFHLSGTSISPPGGWMYKIPYLSVKAPKIAWVKATTYPDLVNEVHKREKANGLTLSLEVDIQDQICQRLPAGYCRDESGQPAMQPISGMINVQQIIQGTRTLFGWFKNGSVDRQEIVRRTYICNQCPENLPIAGCAACAMKPLHEVMNAIVVEPLPTDSMLQACRICSCALKSKVRMKLEDILPHMSQQQKDSLPESCWLSSSPKVAVPPILT